MELHFEKFRWNKFQFIVTEIEALQVLQPCYLWWKVADEIVVYYMLAYFDHMNIPRRTKTEERQILKTR